MENNFSIVQLVSHFWSQMDNEWVFDGLYPFDSKSRHKFTHKKYQGKTGIMFGYLIV